MRCLSPLLLSFLFTLSVMGLRAQGTPVGFAEEFALATDRSKALEQLIPGTDDYYFFHCLHRQNQGAFAEVEPLVKTWIQRHGRSGRVEEIEIRQALLQFDRDPGAAYALLRQRLSLSFSAERQKSGSKPDLPTRLDQTLIASATLTRRALAQHPGTVDGFQPGAFLALAASELDDRQLMSLLRRLTLPDVPNLAALVARNLRDPQSQGFGSLPIHGNLLLDQLEELVRLDPQLLTNQKLVAEILCRLAPSADVQWQRDPAARQAYLDRLQAFAQRLPAAQNSLKAHVLYQRLQHDLAAGAPDRERFLAYLRLPRNAGYVNPDWLRRRGRGEDVASLDSAFATGFEAVRNDEALVRACFEHFFRTEDGFQPYTELVQERWLRRLFAETRILAGTGDMERWYSLLDDPGYYETLKERVEIAFPPTARRDFGAEEPVSIEVDLKNVPTLLVKVFPIDAFDYLRTTGKEVDASIDLDGLIANDEKTWTYTDNPLRRVRRRFEFPQLGKPGTYVVEFLGNGLASRAVIQKGRLQLLERVGAAGHVFTVLDAAGNQVKEATLWCGGREYAPDARGELNVPFVSQGKREQVVLRHGALATLGSFQHQAEIYQIRIGALVDRESLLTRRTARVLVRPTLTANDVPVSLDLLEEAELAFTAVDQDGVSATRTVRGVKFDGRSESVQDIAVPEGLMALTVTVRGRVRNLSLGQTVDLAVGAGPFQLNGIATTAQTSCALLGRSAEGYVVDVLGKNGEPKAEQAVAFRLTHKDYTNPIEVSLKTDARGRIQLGALEGITVVHAAGFPGEIGDWSLADRERNLDSTLHGVAGETLRVPYLGRATSAARSAVALFERRGADYARDAFNQVAIADGFVELRDLAAGDYELWLKEPGHKITVRITAGTLRDRLAVGRDRVLELSGRSPLHVTGVAVADQHLQIQLRNAGSDARVHVFATRYLAPFDPFASLLQPGGPEGEVLAIDHPESSYHSGRAISDEYRYILDRRYVAKYPGNMLRRPGLLLNPWALEESASGQAGEGGGGGRFGGRSGGARPGPAPAKTPGGRAASGRPPGTFADLEFLPEPSRLVANLRPDAAGLVRVPLADLGPGQHVHVVAVDDVSTVYTSLALAEKPLAAKSRALVAGLDPARHFTERKQIEFVAAAGTAVVEDLTTATTETYDSLAAVFRLYKTLSGNTDLDEFAFVLKWPALTPAEKAQAYSKHACHELHFFLSRKDRAFFDQVVKPYLANKAHKTFLDHYLLDADLAAYLEPWAFARLNIVERILLTQRIAAETGAGARHVQDLFELLPPDPEQAAQRFAAALKSSALDAPATLTAISAPPEAKPADSGREGEKAPAAPAARAAEEAKNEVQEKLAKKRAEEPAKDARDEFAADVDKAGVARDENRKADFERRSGLKALYRAPEETRAWVEHHYWHRRIEEQNAELIRVNGFWRDFATHKAGTPFGSSNFAEAIHSFAEMMLALSVLDLPFVAGQHVSERAQNRLTLRPATPLLLVRKEIQEAAAAGKPQSPILISQNFYRLDDRYRFEGNERQDNFVTGEFLVDVPYGCQVVLTNPGSAPRKLEILLQVPRGAVPVQRGFYTRGLPVQLQPFSTATYEYAFYFPAPGQSLHYPVHVSRDGALVAFAEPATMNVVATPSSVDTRSWDHVSQDGTPADVLQFLESQNLQRIDLGRIAWRLRDKGFFGEVLGRLRIRKVYHHDLWSYGILHQDPQATREHLRHADGLIAGCGKALESRLLTIDPIERRSYQHVEFEPLFNARAHRFGKQRQILNQGLASQYGALLAILAYRKALDDADWLSVTYYLLLQDRIDEALKACARVNPASLPTRIQFDYLRAYLDFFQADHAQARGIAERYREHPVERWQGMFKDVLNQLDEADGKAVAVSDQDSRTQQQTAAAASEPALELMVEARRVTVRHHNLPRVEVRYYRLDAEFSFSTSPFVQQGTGAFACVEPGRRDLLTLAAGQKETTFDLPEQFQNSNVLVEVRGAGLTRRQPYFANSLAVQMTESYGHLKVAHAGSGKPLPKVYVKVFARMPGGQVRFHKDGYTDLRGRFDYASVSEPGTQGAERLSILVLSEGDGAMVREVAPPGK